MANVLVDEVSLQNIGNSIRNKKGTSTLYKPAEMATAIDSIPTGGGSVSRSKWWRNDGVPDIESLPEYAKSDEYTWVVYSTKEYNYKDYPYIAIKAMNNSINGYRYVTIDRGVVENGDYIVKATTTINGYNTTFKEIVPDDEPYWVYRIHSADENWIKISHCVIENYIDGNVSVSASLFSVVEVHNATTPPNTITSLYAIIMPNATTSKSTFFNSYIPLRYFKIGLTQNAYYIIQNSAVQSFEVSKADNMSGNMQYTFSSNCLLKLVINNGDFSTITATTNIFDKCTLLRDIEINNTTLWSTSFALNKSPQLTHQSLMNVINALPEIPEGTASPTMTIGAANVAKLTSDEIAIATNKGWTVS